MSGAFRLDEYLAAQRELIDQALDELTPEERTPPEAIHRAMRYSLFAGGKRIRPILTLATGEMFGAGRDELLPVASAIEMIHTYSLIHDDLPALDNDDWRRGRPTCHKVFGEALAILAGDALLTLAFKTLAEAPLRHPEHYARVISEIAQAAGTVEGMIGGQVLDLLTEGQPYDAATLATIHRSKTGALITAAVRVGGIIGGASDEVLARLTCYGQCIGLAFQIADDLLDVTASPAEMGKATGKDAARQKATYPRLFGVEASRAKAEELVTQAIEAVRPLAGSHVLVEIARFIVARRM